jgi:hypothetical protein
MGAAVHQLWSTLCRISGYVSQRVLAQLSSGTLDGQLGLALCLGTPASQVLLLALTERHMRRQLPPSTGCHPLPGRPLRLAGVDGRCGGWPRLSELGSPVAFQDGTGTWCLGQLLVSHPV